MAISPTYLPTFGVTDTLVAPNWTISGGVWSPNPDLLVNKITNSDMELNSTWANWNPGASAQSNEQSYEGTYSWKVSTTIVNYSGAYQDCTLELNKYYRLFGYSYKSSGVRDACLFAWGTNLGYHPSPTNAAASWIQLNTVFQAKDTTTSIGFGKYIGGGESGFIGYFDNVYLCEIEYSNLFALRNFGKQVGIGAPLTFTAGFPCGVVARYSDSNNYLLAWHDGVNAHLDTVIGGSVTPLINTAAAYGAGTSIEIRWFGANTAQLWYGSQIGVNQDVSGVPAGVWAGLFGTDSTCQIGTPTITM